ncbi:hypothetical protein ACTSEZ_03480 [Metabacillus sp. JX24]|uniref:hypothetical protein n=1 Tax=Metabacillus sp. JX24 TaxID=3240759 RepID=UPI00350EA2F3
MGTVVLFHENQDMTVLEDVPEEIYVQLKENAGSESCSCKVNGRTMILPPFHFAVWQEQMDWDFGY